MNKIKSTLLKAAILVLCMSICFMLSAFALEEKYEYSQITYTNAEGETTTLSGGELTAKIDVKIADGSEAESMAFVMLLYDGGKLIDVGIEEKTAGTEETEFSVSVTVPQNAENCRINTVLWSSISGMTPVCNSSLLPGGSSDVVELTVDGVAIEGFDSEIYEYEYTVASTRKACPEVSVKTLDSGAKVEITDPVTFPGKTVIKVTSVDGDEKIYTVKYKSDKPLVENVRFMQSFTDGAAFLPALKQNLQVGSKIVLDREFYVGTISDESFVGCDYLQTAFAWKNGGDGKQYVQAWMSSDYKDWLGFELNRSATVYVLLEAGSVAMADERWGYTKVSGDGISTVDDKKFNTKYSKHIEVGDESVTVTSPNVAQSRGYIHVIVYDGYTE